MENDEILKKIKQLQRTAQSIGQKIAIAKAESKRAKAELLDKYGMSEKDIDDKLEALENDRAKLEKKIRIQTQQAEKILRDLGAKIGM